MALFKSLRGKRENLPSTKTDGYAYFCTDDGTFWIDYKDENSVVQRKQINAKDAETLMGASISTILNSSDVEIPTSKAVLDALVGKVPDDGTTGQILKKTETGTEWADSDVFIATYGTTTSAEIEAAYQAGKICAVCIDGRKNIYFLSYRHNANTHIFTSLRANTANYATSTMFIDACKCEDDAWDNVSNFMTKPANHASTHASGGSDPITPASIGAATMTEVNSAIQTAIGNAIGGSY